ncbi:MAG: hypothetical protein ACI4D6_01635 [Chordicoccus sp.]
MNIKRNDSCSGSCITWLIGLFIFGIACALIEYCWWLFFTASAVVLIYMFYMRSKNQKARLEEIEAAKHTQRCPVCRAEVRFDDPFKASETCEYCGAEVRNDHSLEPVRPQNFSRQEIYMLIAAGVCLVLGCVGLALF